MKVSDFDFHLPPQLIAQEPPAERGASRLLVLDRATGALSDRQFRDLPSLLQPGDLLVVNDTRVFPARLLGRRLPGGGAVECLLVRRIDVRENGEIWEALVHPGQRLRPGSTMDFGWASRFAPRQGHEGYEGHEALIHGEILERHFHGRRTVRLWTDGTPLDRAIEAIGHVPLPPYIKRDDQTSDRDRYQTVYARARGSIAAPTAGLHFTPALLERLAARAIELATITLHIGYGTFQPVRVEHVEEHRMEEEDYDVSAETATALTRALADRRRVIAAGTTTTRALESLKVMPDGGVLPRRGSTDVFIHPGYRFRIVSGLLTNFHLPRSSLLIMVSAFAGRENVLAAYRHAVQNGYRFYSYGDTMLIL